MKRSKNTKADMKFKRVMHEFSQKKLTSNKKSVTDKKQALAIAFQEARKVNPDYSMEEAGVVGNDPAVKGVFSIDSIEGKTFPGYTFGEDWNGWATPYFEEKEAQEIADALKGKKVDDDTTDANFYFPEEDETYMQQVIKTEDGDKTVYPIGAYAWIWEKASAKIENPSEVNLQKLYESGSPQQLWDNGWDEKQKSHFLIDHADMYIDEMGKNFNVSAEKFAKLKYEKLPDTIKKQVVIHHAMGIYNNGGVIKDKSLPPAKKKIKKRRDALMASLPGIKSEAARKVIKKKIIHMDEQLNHKPSTKEKIKEGKGKFALDVPSMHSKSMYKRLWSMKVFPQIHKLNGTSSIIVKNRNNLGKAYQVYADILKEHKEAVPPLSKISRKL